MKRKFVKKAILVLAMVILLGTFGSKETFAMEMDKINQSEIALRTTHRNRTTIDSTRWTTVAESSKGFNCNVYISISNNMVSRTGIRMLNRRGKILWQSDDAIAFNQYRAQFWCGSDVYKIQLTTNSGGASVIVDW